MSVWSGSLSGARLCGSHAPPRPGSTPSQHRVPDIKIPEGRTGGRNRTAEEEENEWWPLAFTEGQLWPASTCSLCTPPMLPGKVLAGRYIIQWNLWRLHKILILSIFPWGNKTAPQWVPKCKCSQVMHLMYFSFPTNSTQANLGIVTSGRALVIVTVHNSNWQLLFVSDLWRNIEMTAERRDSREKKNSKIKPSLADACINSTDCHKT